MLSETPSSTLREYKQARQAPTLDTLFTTDRYYIDFIRHIAERFFSEIVQFGTDPKSGKGQDMQNTVRLFFVVFLLVVAFSVITMQPILAETASEIDRNTDAALEKLFARS